MLTFASANGTNAPPRYAVPVSGISFAGPGPAFAWPAVFFVVVAISPSPWERKSLPVSGRPEVAELVSLAACASHPGSLKERGKGNDDRQRAHRRHCNLIVWTSCSRCTAAPRRPSSCTTRSWASGACVSVSTGADRRLPSSAPSSSPLPPPPTHAPSPSPPPHPSPL